MMMFDQKKELRQIVRQRFQGNEERARQSRLICEHLRSMPEFQAARMICAYIPLRQQADILPLIKVALREGKRVLLPRVEGPGEMTLREVSSLKDLIPGAFHIPEPSDSAPEVAPDRIDLLLTPLQAIDRTGMRLGKGGGFYDRLLQKHDCFSIGIVLSWQWVDQVPADSWDRRLNAAADQNGIIRFT